MNIEVYEQAMLTLVRERNTYKMMYEEELVMVQVLKSTIESYEEDVKFLRAELDKRK